MSSAPNLGHLGDQLVQRAIAEGSLDGVEVDYLCPWTGQATTGSVDDDGTALHVTCSCHDTRLWVTSVPPEARATTPAKTKTA